MPIDLYDTVTMFLEKFQDPSVKIVTFLRDVGFYHACGQDKPRARDMFLREAGFQVVMGGQIFAELFLLLFKEVLIRSAIAGISTSSITRISSRILS